MGYSTRCAISGFPIEPGAHVVAFLVCKEGDDWVPMTLPIETTYDGLGGITGNVNTGAEVMAGWISTLKRTMVERGGGANKYHQTPVRKADLTLITLLTYLKQNRLRVRTPSFKYPKGSFPSPPIHPGRVTRRRVEKNLFPLSFFGKVDREGYSAVRVNRHEVHVRWHNYSKARQTIKLNVAQRHFKARWPCVVTPDPESVGSLVLRVFSSEKGYDGFPPRREKHHKVCLSLVRQDVWDKVQTLQLPKPFAPAMMKKNDQVDWLSEAMRYSGQVRERVEAFKGNPNADILLPGLGEVDGLVGQLLSKRPYRVPSVGGNVVDIYRQEGLFSLDVVGAMAEMARTLYFLVASGIPCQPSNQVGPTYPDWGLWMKFYQSLEAGLYQDWKMNCDTLNPLGQVFPGLGFLTVFLSQCVRLRHPGIQPVTEARQPYLLVT